MPDDAPNDALSSSQPNGALRPSTYLVLAALASSALILAAGLWSGTRERRALLRMSPEVRERVYLGALASLRELCPPGTSASVFESQCAEQAAFLSQFPECDDACRDLLRPNLPQPTR